MNHSTRRERQVGFVLIATAIILPSLAIYAPLALAPLLILLAFAVLALDARRAFAQIRRLWPLIALFVALDLWSFCSVLWSIIPGHSAVQALRFLGVSAAGLIVFGSALATAEPARIAIGRSVIIGIVVALILYAIEWSLRAPIMRFFHPLPLDVVYAHYNGPLVYGRLDRGLVVLVLTMWSALFAPVARWLRAAILIGIVAITGVMVTEAAVLAVIAGIGAFVIAWFSPRLTALLMVGGLLIISVAIPVATPSYDRVAALYAEHPNIKWSGIHRLLIWRFSSDRISERPLLGWGMDASRAMPGGKTDITTLLPPGNYPAQALALPLHPHNATLQLLLELGIPGLILGLALMISVIWRVTWQVPLPRERRAGALGLVAAGLTISLLSFGIWQEWWQSALWLAAAFFAATGVPRDAKVPSVGEASAVPTATVSRA